jgi:hypothetical protein
MTTGSRTNCEIKSSGERRSVSSSVVRTGIASILLALATPVFSDTELSLTGSVTPTDISGFGGTPFTVGHPESTQAVYGVWSVERNDKPCYVGALTEDINNSKDITGEIKSLCGNNPTSKEMKVQFGGIKFAEHTFVRALRVCMNKDNTRLKGLQIRGRKIDENGNVSDLPPRYPDSSGSSGLTPLVDLNAPSDQRLNCDGWKKWVECPQNQIATAMTAHFSAGPNPRSVTGIALQCRAVSKGG